MLRTVSFLALVSGIFVLSAYRAAEPKFGDQLFPVNTTVARFSYVNPSGQPGQGATDQQAEQRTGMRRSHWPAAVRTGTGLRAPWPEQPSARQEARQWLAAMTSRRAVNRPGAAQ